MGLHGILVEVVEDEAVDAVARERPLAPHRENRTAAADDLRLVGRADISRGLRAALDGCFGKEFAVLARLDDALHAAVELRGEHPRVGGDRHATVGVEPQQVGGQQRRSPDALAVLRRHGDDQAADAPLGEGLQQPVIGSVKGLQLQKRVDRTGEVGEGRLHGIGKKRFKKGARPEGRTRSRFPCAATRRAESDEETDSEGVAAPRGKECPNPVRRVRGGRGATRRRSR